ncbi:hypothetical protein J3R82DRAFT_11444 [Butyriboletus roseoflavus]|nr:hypothetical protein J3R82DRAFT_11444 [Butyriboletus roseoflavus]
MGTKRHDMNFQSKIIVDLPSHTARLGPYPPCVPFVTGDTQDEPSTQDEECSFRSMEDTDDLGKGAKQPTFESKAPLAVNHLRFSVPRPKVNTWSPEIADDSNSKVWPLPRVPGPSNGGLNTVGFYPFAPRRLPARSCMTTASAWSQESGSTMGLSPDVESQKTYWPLTADMIVPRVTLGDQADVGEVIRRSTPPGPYSHPETPLRRKSARSGSYRNFRPPSRICRTSTIVFAPNNSVV